LRESVKVGDAPLDPARTYSLATNDFMARGGDDYVMFLDIKPRLPLATSNPHDGIRQQDRSCVVLMCRSSAARDVRSKGLASRVAPTRATRAATSTARRPSTRSIAWTIARPASFSPR